ncbi:MAG TPA: hypothetical protein DCY20_03120, partial [Firmicutes bacterium]|nr:hypothetical protein [Bacillota bacterium]
MATINLQLNVDKTEVLIGDTFTYTILYANPSTTENAQNIIIKDTLPTQIQYVSYISSPDVQSVSVTRVNNQDIITFTMNSPLVAGTTGMLRITAKFPLGSTAEFVNGQANVAVNSVQATGTNILTTLSNSVTVTPKTITPNWTVTKYKNSPVATPTIESIIEYGIDVTGNTNQLGALNLTTVSVVDTLPTGAEFVSASSGGVYQNQQVTWDLGTINVGSKKTVTVKIKFPANTVTISSTVTNSAIAYATPIGMTQQTKTATFSHGFASVNVAIGAISKTTRTSNDKYSIGQTIDYIISGIKNQGNVLIDRFELRDTFPVYYRLTSLSTGSFSNGNYSLTLYYQTNLNATDRTWTGSPFSNPNDITLNVSSLGLVANEYVTTIKYSLTNGVDGFDVTFAQNKQIHFYGTVLTTPTLPYNLSNSATLYGYKTNYATVTKTASRTVTIISPMPWLEGVKNTTNNIANYNPNSIVTYSFTIKNNNWATGNYVDPIAIDVLPLQLENISLVSVSTTNAPNLTAAPTVDLNYTVSINGVTYKAIKVLASGSLYPGQYITVIYQAKIKSDALNGSFTNDVYLGTQNVTTTYQNTNVVSDIYDLNKNGLIIDKWVKNSYSTYVNFVGSLTSVKWVKGEL